MTETERQELVDGVEAAGLASPEQVCDWVLDAAARGGIEAGRTELASAIRADREESTADIGHNREKAMKIISQQKWIEAAYQPAQTAQQREQFWAEVESTLSGTNPRDNDCPPGTEEDAVCITEDHIAELRARADWYGMENEEPAYPALPQHLIDFANALEIA